LENIRFNEPDRYHGIGITMFSFYIRADLVNERSIGIFEDSWDTGDSPLSKCGDEPMLPLLLPLALISSCIAFSHLSVAIGIAQLVVCWFKFFTVFDRSI
jgi:hypothetical protein